MQEIAKNDIYFLYDAKCYACKQQTILYFNGIETEEYEIRFDTENKKCNLCKKSEFGCYYKRTRYIYAVCKTFEDEIGKGT